MIRMTCGQTKHMNNTKPPKLEMNRGQRRRYSYSLVENTHRKVLDTRGYAGTVRNTRGNEGGQKQFNLMLTHRRLTFNTSNIVHMTKN